LRSGALDALRGRPGTVAILALVQVAAPFLLISVGEQDLSSSLTGILVATAPIFSFLLAIRLEREARAEGAAMLGVAVGIAGVILLLGIDAGGGSAALIGGSMVVLASLGYALGAFYLRRNLSDAQPIGVVASAMGASALMTAPLAAATFPSQAPDLETFGSLFVLGVGGTGIAFLLFYTLIAEVGPTRSSLVLYGVLLLDESFTAATFAGLVLILGGSWLAAEGRLPWQPKKAVRVAARPAPEAAR
jgi:drug/metabolite transporter (DMT)-like permease